MAQPTFITTSERRTDGVRRQGLTNRQPLLRIPPAGRIASGSLTCHCGDDTNQWVRRLHRCIRPECQDGPGRSKAGEGVRVSATVTPETINLVHVLRGMDRLHRSHHTQLPEPRHIIHMEHLNMFDPGTQSSRVP